MSKSQVSAVRSMTGQGHATHDSEIGTLRVEVRTVNNRGFKCTLRVGDRLSAVENRIETLSRSLIHRGSVQLTASLQRTATDSLPSIDHAALQSYYEQLDSVRQSVGSDQPIDLTSLISMPGVLTNNTSETESDDKLWQIVQAPLKAAIENLNEMRAAEGANMAQTLLADCQQIQTRLDNIQELAPQALDAYQQRLESKICRVLEDRDVKVDTVDLLREVQIYADRADISEEITRLGSHLKMFVGVLDGTANESGQREPTGRKLDFIIQEMFRETNTIGSKAAHAGVSAEVVEIKCAIERMRELVQNLE